jgi:hypothetical protein
MSFNVSGCALRWKLTKLDRYGIFVVSLSYRLSPIVMVDFSDATRIIVRECCRVRIVSFINAHLLIGN